MTDAQTQAEDGAVPVGGQAAGAVNAAAPTDTLQPGWTQFDLGTALQELRSVREGVMRRALRQLHLRWWHAPAKRMRELLQLAGANSKALDAIQDIVDTCRTCRQWTRPGCRSMTTTRLSTYFNETIQVDLLFHNKHVIFHAIDEAIRWTVAVTVANQQTETIQKAIHTHWLQHFSNPGTIISDQEGALKDEAMGQWLEQRGIRLVLRAKGQHAQLVERHHELLRKQLRVIDDQCTADALKVDFDYILSEAVLSKNCLISIKGRSPYEALYGRVPPLLGTQAAELGTEDDRDPARLREIAVQAMVEATAAQRASIAANSKTRPAGQLMGLQTGDLVEFHRPAVTKDVSGWKGPAVVTDVTTIDQGTISIRWQSRVLICRVQDIRRALVYWAFLTERPAKSPIEEVFRFTQHLHDDVVRFGWINQPPHWRECAANKQHPAVLLAGLHVAACSVYMEGCVGFRLGKAGPSARSLEAVAGCDDGMLLWWDSERPSEVYHFFHNPSRRVGLESLFGKTYEGTAFMQLLCVGQDEVKQVRNAFAEVPHLGGMYDPGMPRLVERAESVAGSDGTDITVPEPRKRQYSDASSHNPRPATAAKLTTEAQEQLQATNTIQTEGVDIPVPEDDDLDMEQYFESLVPRQFYHLSEADRLAPVYGNSPPDTMHFVPGGTFSPPPWVPRCPRVPFNFLSLPKLLCTYTGSTVRCRTMKSW